MAGINAVARQRKTPDRGRPQGLRREAQADMAGAVITLRLL